MSAQQRVSLVDYWLGKAYPNLSSDEAFQLASNPPEGEAQYREWLEEHGAKQMQAWVEVRAEAAKKKITIEAYPRIINVEPRDWYPPPSNVPEAIPPEYFERDDIMIGPTIPPVIYDGLGGPFSAPWAHPVVVLKDTAAKSHAVPQCARRRP